MDYSQEYVQKLFDENRFLKADNMLLFSKNVELHKENEALREALEAAMEYISESPCDPDITNAQAQAWTRLLDAKPNEAIDKAYGETK